MSILSDLTTDDLRYFVALANAGGVTAGAELLGVSQPAFSKRMDRWRDYRPPLVRKQGARDVLTDRGIQVAASARAILRQFDDLRSYLKANVDAPNSLYLAAGSVAVGWYLAPAIAQLTSQFSDWRYRTQVLRGRQRIAGVADGRLDMAIVSHDRAQVDLVAHGQELAMEPLATQPLCVVAKIGTAAAHEMEKVLRGQEVPLELLTKWDLVGLDAQSGVRRRLERQLASPDRQLHFSAETGGWAGAKEYSRHGLAVALLPVALLSEQDSRDFVVRRLIEEASIRHSLVWRRGDTREMVKNANESIKEAAKEFETKTRRRWEGAF